MQKKISLALVAVALLLGSVAQAQDFYVIAGGGPSVGTRITRLPYTINNSGFYFLGSDLNYTGTGNAINIDHNDVTLDLMGHLLSGPGPTSATTGINITGRYNVEIRNGTVTSFGVGILDDFSTGTHRVINIRAANNYGGILLRGSNNLIKNCTVTNNIDAGISLQGAGLITDNVANNNGSGIGMDGPGSLLGNSACNNGNNNFVLGTSVATSIVVNNNSAFGLNLNYKNFALPPSGVVMGTNSGTP
jgi:parallel beta-helix repeat protein